MHHGITPKKIAIVGLVMLLIGTAVAGTGVGIVAGLAAAGGMFYFAKRKTGESGIPVESKPERRTLAGLIERLQSEGIEKVSAASIADRMRRDLAIDITAVQAGRMLRDAGVKSTRTSAGVVWDIAAAAAVLGEIVDGGAS